jgi:hypothetical protein
MAGVGVSVGSGVSVGITVGVAGGTAVMVASGEGVGSTVGDTVAMGVAVAVAVGVGLASAWAAAIVNVNATDALRWTPITLPTIRNVPLETPAGGVTSVDARPLLAMVTVLSTIYVVPDSPLQRSSTRSPGR